MESREHRSLATNENGQLEIKLTEFQNPKFPGLQKMRSTSEVLPFLSGGLNLAQIGPKLARVGVLVTTFCSLNSAHMMSTFEGIRPTTSAGIKRQFLMPGSQTHSPSSSFQLRKMTLAI